MPRSVDVWASGCGARNREPRLGPRAIQVQRASTKMQIVSIRAYLYDPQALTRTTLVFPDGFQC